MKPLKQQKNYKRPFQRSANDIFLNKLMQRKRSVVSTRTVARKYGKTIATLFLLALALLGIWLGYDYVEKKGFLNVREVEITGASTFVNFKDITSLAENNLMGKKYFAVNLVKIEQLLKNNFLGAKNISVQRAQLGKIKIIIEERVPLAVLFSTTEQKYYLIDGEGYVLGEVDKDFSGLPVVKYESSVKIGSFVEKDMVPITIEIMKLSEKDELNVSSISFYPKYVRMFVSGGVEVLMSNSKSCENSMNVITTLLRKSGPEGKKVSKIDLRYDKVIVSY
jgi:cell division septal protein FtsQ